MGNLRRIAVTLAAGSLLPAAPGPAAAAERAFNLNYALASDTTEYVLNWVSLPYHYFPNGNVGQTPQGAVDLCTALNGGVPGSTAKVRAVGRWLVSEGRIQVQSCADTGASAFLLEPGRGYALVPAADGVVVDIVGSNDESYAVNLGGTSRVPLEWDPASTNLNWVSLPTSVRADTSLDLCLEANGGPTPIHVSGIARLERGTWTTQDCGAGTSAFDVVPGQAYAFVPTGPSKSLAWTTYGCGDRTPLAVQAGADVALTWSGPLATYDVYREPMKQASCFLLLGQVTGNTFVDAGAVPAPPPLLYYDVRAQ